MTRVTLVFTLILLPLGVACLLAGDKPVGEWACTATTPSGGELSWTLSLKEENGRLTGSAASDEGEIPISDLRYEDGTLTFKVSLDTGTYSVTVHFKGNKLDGNWKAESGDSGAVSGTKKA